MNFSGNRRLFFVLFAAGILFAMVREWKAPVACLRPTSQTGASVKLR
jgi:hypothetical protein